MKNEELNESQLYALIISILDMTGPVKVNFDHYDEMLREKHLFIRVEDRDDIVLDIGDAPLENEENNEEE
jgi:hypothetical protein